jgi:thioester reductase-like protein
VASADAIGDVIAATAAMIPNATAVRAGTTQWCFRELLEAAGEVRDRLNGCEASTAPAAFVAQRVAASIAMMLGCLRAGRAFAPIDPRDPDPVARARRMGASQLIPDPDGFLEDGRCLYLEGMKAVTSDEPAAYRLLTSGTSARSKVVEVSRSNLSAYSASLRTRLEINYPLRWAAVSSLATDLAFTAIFPVLASGGSVHIVDDNARRDARAFQRYLDEHDIQAIKMTPSHYRALLPVEEHGCGRPLAMLVLGGETLQPALAAAILNGGRANRIVNHYGPTETTIGVACYIAASSGEIDLDAPSVPIGTPLGAAELFIVNESGRPVATGGVGELLIGGPTVATGYVGDVELTAERFIVTDPDGAGPRRFFRSNDFCRRLESGAVEFVRRGGTEVKIRGWRVEPSDVEYTICSLPGVRDARVVLEGEGTSASLDAILVAEGQAPGAIRAALAARLPAHLIPRRIGIVSELPLSLSGKFDRAAALRLLDECRVAAIPEKSDPLVEEIADLMAPYLGGVRPGPAEDFSRLGGDSLAAIHLLSRLQQLCHNLNAETLLRDMTPLGVAASIRSVQSRLEPERTRRHAGGLSPAQTWFFAQRFADAERWCQAVALDAKHPIDAVALEAAVNWVVGRHPLLRSRIEGDGTGPKGWCCGTAQTRNATAVPIEEWDGSDAEVQAATARLLDGMNIQSGLLFSAMGLRRADGRCLLILIAHHLVVDGVSWRILLDDLARAYEAALEGSLSEPYPEPGAFWDWVDALGPLSPPPSAFALCGQPADASAIATFNDGVTAAIERAALHSGRGIHEILLAAFAAECAEVMRETTVSIDIESHGRTADTGGAVGWFTRTAALTLHVEGAKNFDALIEATATALGQIGSRVQAYGETAPLCFNYLGRFVPPAGGRWSHSPLILGPLRGANARAHTVTGTARISSGRLSLDIVFDTRRLSKPNGETLVRRVADRLAAFADPLQKGRVAGIAIRLIDWSTIGQLMLAPATAGSPSTLHSAGESEPSVLLTGATGFLGSYLLREFLEGSARLVVCVVRPGAEGGAVERLAASFLRYFDMDIRAYGDRLRVVEGDITKRGLGIPAKLYQELARELDTVVHSAADVRLFADEQRAHAANVEGTREIIAFAEAGCPKVIHLTSTMSIAGMWRGVALRPFAESDLFYGQDFRSAYERSKLRAEELLRQFTARGGIGWAHRLGSLAAPVGLGRSQFNLGENRIAQTIRLYARCGVAPGLSGELLLLVPVDLTARAVVGLATRAWQQGGATHLIDDSASEHEEIIDTLGRMGHRVQLLTATEFSERTRETPSGELVRWWLSHGPRRVIFKSRQTAEVLAKCGVSLKVDRRQAWLERVVRDALQTRDGEADDNGEE